MYAKTRLHLKNLDDSSVDIEASILASTDGLVISTTLPCETNADNIGAICAGAFLLGHHTSKECTAGMLEQVSIKCKDNSIVITHAGEELMLAVIVKPYADFEQLNFNLKQSIEKLPLSMNN